MKPLFLYAFRSSPRMYQHPAVASLRAISLSIFNYLGPVVRTLGQLTAQFVRVRIIPRILAVAAALIDPTPPRFQQRDPPVIIVPIVLIQLPRGSDNLHHPDSDTPGPSLVPASPIASPAEPRPTFVIPFTVLVEPSVAGSR
jgi:hypothetical protein